MTLNICAPSPAAVPFSSSCWASTTGRPPAWPGVRRAYRAAWPQPTYAGTLVDHSPRSELGNPGKHGEDHASGWTGGIGPLTSSSAASLLVRRREHVTRPFGSRDLGQCCEQLRPDDGLAQAAVVD